MELRFPGGRLLSLDRPRIMGILNVTPDSFSDGGRFADAGAAVAHAARMLAPPDAADLLDVGGESTRPGAERVPADEQIARVVGVIERILAAHPAALISVDTTLAPVAAAALDAGAAMLNDISAGREDPAMLGLAAARGAPLVLMHMLGEPATMQQAPRYDDVVGEVESYLLERAAAAERAGVPRTQVVLDPGIGFGKTVEHNLALLAAMPRLVGHGYPVLLGASRKRFLATVGGAGMGDPADRVAGTVATTVLAAMAGVQIMRVHDVAPNRQAAAVAAAVRAHRAAGEPGSSARA